MTIAAIAQLPDTVHPATLRCVTHESTLRSYQALARVRQMIASEAPPPAVKAFLADLESVVELAGALRAAKAQAIDLAKDRAGLRNVALKAMAERDAAMAELAELKRQRKGRKS